MLPPPEEEIVIGAAPIAVKEVQEVLPEQETEVVATVLIGAVPAPYKS